MNQRKRKKNKDLFVVSLVDLLDVGYDRILRPNINIGTWTASPFTKSFWIKDLVIEDVKYTTIVSEGEFEKEKDGVKIKVSKETYTLKISFVLNENWIEEIHSKVNNEIKLNLEFFGGNPNDEYSDEFITKEEIGKWILDTQIKWLNDDERQESFKWSEALNLNIKTEFYLRKSVRSSSYVSLNLKGDENVSWIDEVFKNKKMIKDLFKDKIKFTVKKIAKIKSNGLIFTLIVCNKIN